MTKPRIIVRMGAAYDCVIINGETYDRRPLNHRQRNAMTALIVDALFPDWREKAPARTRKGGRK